jgi:uncharacterized membrane protein (DUF4010 family)
VLILMLATMIPSLFLWYRVRKEPSQLPEQENPTQLKSAIFFGAMYAVVLFALAGAKEYIADEAQYTVAGISGLTDMDAITLSAARRSRTDAWIAAEGWRLILIAALANLAFKTGIVGVLGNRRLLVQIALLYGVPFLVGVGLLLFWPW